MMKLALILVLFAVASISAHDDVSCATNDYECQCEKLLDGHCGFVGRGGGRESWEGERREGWGGRWGGRWRGRFGRSEDEDEEEIEQQVQEREKRHSGRGGKRQELEACATKTGITITTPSPSDWGTGTKPQLPDEIRNCLIETRLTDMSMVKDSVLDQTAVITQLTQRLSNSWKVTMAADQVSAIVGQVSGCDNTTASSPLRFLELQKCLVKECIIALTPQ
ncbi:uncharacterized protein [Palaemon carinicauda]|uniref:uncharacterized protein n=1 Tax=Palaemon carinicauda TaxID=392227 RepID=UPI0035B5A312